MEEYISKAFKSLEEEFSINVEEPIYLKEEEETTPKTILDLFNKDSSYNIIYDFEEDGITYSLYAEATCDGDSCDATFGEFNKDNIDGVIVDILDSERNFLGTLHDITLNTSIDDAINKSKEIIFGTDKDVVSIKDVKTETDDNEPESNERVFIKDFKDEVKEEALLEAKEFNLTDKEDLEKAQEILNKNKDEDTIEQIVDVSAETIDDLKKSYIGSIILRCQTCRTMIYKNAEDLVKAEGEEELYNVEEECPHCGAKDGFEIVGQVASLDTNPEKVPEEPIQEKEPNEEKKSEEDSKDNEVKKDEIELDVYEEPTKKDLTAIDNGNEHVGEVASGEPGIDKNGHVKESLEEGHKEEDEKFPNPEKNKLVGTYKDVDIYDCTCGKFVAMINGEKVKKETIEELKDYIDKNGLNESVCPKCGKEICECDKNKNHDMKLEMFDDYAFDKLVKRYLYETYSNIKDYVTTDASIDDKNNKIVLEGKIDFKSGKSKTTKFIFEAKELTKKGKIKFSGLNEMFSAKKSFTLLGNVKNNKLLSESLSYNYRINEQKVVGKVCSAKKRK